MIKIIIISVLISVGFSSAITVFAMHITMYIMSDFLTHFLTQTEDRFDKKAGCFCPITTAPFSRMIYLVQLGLNSQG